ncbi:MAG: hypothetical protein AAGG81_09260 [Chlamydiota bacterium]
MKIKFLSFITLLLLTFPAISFAEARSILRDNIVKAKPGDYIVTNQSKMFTVLYIRNTTDNGLILEEISAPLNRIPKNRYTWKQWIENEAPGHTSWVVYWLNTNNGDIERAFSFTKNCWFKIKDSDNFLTTLINIRFQKIPLSKRKRVGPKSGSPPNQDWRNVWQPRMIVDGETIPGVQFDAWVAKWPSDGSELSGKTIEVFTPEDSERYPSYFPYWLQVSGMIGKARVRIMDSGAGLKSPKQL